MEYILETQNLTKVYGTKEAAKDVSLHIREGQIYGLIGRNGAGKTTIMRRISGQAVLLGLPLMWLIYSALNSGLEKIFKGANIIPYIPDQVIRESKPDAVRGCLVAAVTIAVFLPVSIRVFDQKDVK